MFNRKIKAAKYKFSYGKSPSAIRFSSKSKSQAFSTKKTDFFSRLKRKIKIFAAIAIIIFLAYEIFFSGDFNIKDTKFSNEELANADISLQIRELSNESIGKNLIFFDTNILEAKILEKFPELQKVDVHKKYFNSLSIEFQKYPLAANLINESSSVKKTMIINSIGYVVKEDYEDTTLPYIRIKSDEPINSQKAAINNDVLQYILDSKKYFEEKFGMRAVEILYKPVPREVHLLTEKNFYIWLDLQVPFEDQFKKLKKAAIKLDIYKENLAYIDLRISGNNGEKIIYKRR